MKRAQALAFMREYDRAHDEHLFAGAGDPDDRPYLEARWKALRERMVMRLEGSPVVSVQRDGPAQ